MGLIFLFFELRLKSAGFHFRIYQKSFLRKYKIFFDIRAKKFHFMKYKEFFSRRIFLFFGAWDGNFHFQHARKDKKFLIVELWNSISRNIRKHENFFNIRARDFNPLKYEDFFTGWIFFCFSDLGWESAPESP